VKMVKNLKMWIPDLYVFPPSQFLSVAHFIT
jgi:hypothetical protein